MFKENKEFWLYSVGIIVMLIATYFLVMGYQFPFVGFLTDQKAKEYKYNSQPAYFLQSDKDYRAIIRTNRGDFEIDLYERSAPKTVNNFVFLADEGYYDGVSFHRLIRDFLVQTGSRMTLDNDPDNDAIDDPGYFFEDEINWDSLGLSSAKRDELQRAGYSNDQGIQSRRLEKYSVAMANAGPDTNGSQFFIILADNSDSRLDVLQGRHTVFGTVVSGFQVLDTINQAQIEQEQNDAISRPLGDYYIKEIIIRVI